AELAERRAADPGPVPVRPRRAHPVDPAAASGIGLGARSWPGVADRHRPDPARLQRLLPARLRVAFGADRAQLPVAGAAPLEPLAALRRAGLRRARDVERLAAEGPAVAPRRAGAVRQRPGRAGQGPVAGGVSVRQDLRA